MKDKLKVVMLCGYPFGQLSGGVATHVDGLTHHLSKMKDVELHVISFGDKSLNLKKENLIIHSLKRRKLYFVPFFAPIALCRLMRKVIKINPDIVHIQGISNPYCIVSLFLKNKYPTIVTIHNVTEKEIPFKRGFSVLSSILFSKPLEKYFLPQSQNIIVCSPVIKDLLVNMTDSQIHIIPNGIDYKAIQDIKPKSIDHPFILFVGLLKKAKGVDILLNAVPIILKSAPNIRVCIIGSGDQENDLKRLVKELDIENHVDFLGFISGNQKFEYYKSADICIFPSLFEPFGIVLLEAMACGKAIIATNIGGIPFLVEDKKNGYLFERGNKNELAKKVIFLLNNKELRETMGNEGKERAKEYSWDKIAQRTVNLYKNVINDKQNRILNIQQKLV